MRHIQFSQHTPVPVPIGYHIGIRNSIVVKILGRENNFIPQHIKTRFVWIHPNGTLEINGNLVKSLAPP